MGWGWGPSWLQSKWQSQPLAKQGRKIPGFSGLWSKQGHGNHLVPGLSPSLERRHSIGCSRGPETFHSNVRCHTNSYDHGSQKHTEETGRHISLATWPKSCRSKQAMSIWGPSLQHLSTRLDHLHTNKTEQQRKQSAVLRASASSP